MLGDYAKFYTKHDRNVETAFAGVAEFYAKLLRNRSLPERLAGDTEAITNFLGSMYVLSEYGKECDDALRNTVNQLSAAIVVAAPEMIDAAVNGNKTAKRRR